MDDGVRWTYPCTQPNSILLSIPVPSAVEVHTVTQGQAGQVYHHIPLNIHVMVAARGVAVLSPTPTPFSIASVASIPVMEEQNACVCV